MSAVGSVPIYRAEVMQVIKTTLTVRGDGKMDAFRMITQYWSFAGELLAEVDSLANVKFHTQ